jgi:predicted metalloprotease with PDZ domain
MPRTRPARTVVDPIRYRVSMPEPQSHELHVLMEVPALPERAVFRFAMPAWAPGSYMVRDFARQVYDLEVTDERGQPLPLERIDKQRWEVGSGGRPVRIRYRVFAFEETVRTSYFDDRHAYWNGTSLCFYVEGELARPCEVEVEPRRGWRVATALPRRPGAAASFRAADYDELADSPFEVGTHALHAFNVGRVRFEIALFGRTNMDLERFLGDLRRIVTATGKLFGGFPFDRYLFIVHCLGARGGGLEHANSCTLDIAGLGFEDGKAYLRVNELAAHEFFHAWNVKRIRDRVLGPFDYERENYTRLLWFHEGFTEYMESLVLLRAGILDAEAYVSELGEDWSKYLARPGRNVTPLAELSFEAWTKLYKPSDNHVNRTVSYYEKGKWAALVLELGLREATAGRRGVADLFRQLWRDFGRRGRGLGEEDLEAAVAAIAGSPQRAFFQRYIRGTTELPVPALLARAGVLVERKNAWEDEDDGVKARRARSWIGLTFAAGGANDRATVKNVVPGSPAWRGGLTYGDELVAVGGVRVSSTTAPRRLADVPIGAAVELTFFRRDLLRTVTLRPRSNPERKVTFELAENPPAAARAIRRGWLGI